jgi:hypothetical protein
VRLVQALRQMLVCREAYQMKVVDQMGCDAGGILINPVVFV